MARKPRLHYPGAFYHVILRGNAGQDIFFLKKDRGRFFSLLQEGIERYEFRVHAYCLMTNHIHLALQVGDVTLSRIMQNVSFRYTRYINRSRKQVGHLFQGRYKALLIDADSYLLELVRYIHNNPVRAGQSKTAEGYLWSSHRVYLGKVKAPWLTTEWILSQFAENRKRAVELFGDFVSNGKDEGHREEFYQGNVEGRILGEDRFAEEALQKGSQQLARQASLEQVLQTVCEQYKISLSELSAGSRLRRIAEARAVAAFIVREMDHLSLTDLSRMLGRDLSGLSQAASRLDKRLRSDVEMGKKIHKMLQLL